MVHRLGLSFSSLLLASDARGPRHGDAGAYGIVASDITADEVQQLLQVGEAPALSIARANGELGGLKHADRPLLPTVPKS